MHFASAFFIDDNLLNRYNKYSQYSASTSIHSLCFQERDARHCFQETGSIRLHDH